MREHALSEIPYGSRPMVIFRQLGLACPDAASGSLRFDPHQPGVAQLFEWDDLIKAPRASERIGDAQVRVEKHVHPKRLPVDQIF